VVCHLEFRAGLSLSEFGAQANTLTPMHRLLLQCLGSLLRLLLRCCARLEMGITLRVSTRSSVCVAAGRDSESDNSSRYIEPVPLEWGPFQSTQSSAVLDPRRSRFRESVSATDSESEINSTDYSDAVGLIVQRSRIARTATAGSTDTTAAIVALAI
jgi:hypothetical protein